MYKLDSDELANLEEKLLRKALWRFNDLFTVFILKTCQDITVLIGKFRCGRGKTLAEMIIRPRYRFTPNGYEDQL